MSNRRYFRKSVAAQSIFAIATVVLSLGAMGCNDTVDDAANGAAGIFDGRAPELQHRFQAEQCSEPLELKVIGASLRVSYEFQGRDLVRNDQFFSDPDCQGEVAIDVYYRGQYTKQAEVQNDVHQIDLSYASATVIPRNAAGVNALNTFNFCGISDWTIGREDNVTGVSRDAKCPAAATPRAVYDLYSVENNVLVFGKGSDADKATPDKRAVELTRDTTYREL